MYLLVSRRSYSFFLFLFSICVFANNRIFAFSLTDSSDQVGYGRKIVSGHVATMELPDIHFLTLTSDNGVYFEGDHCDVHAGNYGAVADITGDGRKDIVVAARDFDNNEGKGAVYIVYGTEDAFTNLDFSQIESEEVQGTFVTGNSNGDLFGASLAVGDVDKDGHYDILIGAPGYDDSRGAAYFIPGWADFPTPILLNQQERAVFSGEAPYSYFGTSVSLGGDVNGDGFLDIIIGAPTPTSGVVSGVYVIFGTPRNRTIDIDFMNHDPFPPSLGFSIYEESLGDFFGSSVASGDVNGDGIADILIGATGANENKGIVYLIFGRTDYSAIYPLTNSPYCIKIFGTNSFDFAGSTVHIGKDVNGDSYNDMLLSISDSINGGGKVYLIYGNETLRSFQLQFLDPEQGIVIYPEGSDHQLGTSLSCTEDINKDGLADILLGAPGYSTGRGRAYLLLGNSTLHDYDLSTWQPSWGFQFINNEASGPNQQAGSFVALTPDFTGDGVPDFLIGMPEAGNCANGRMYALNGPVLPTAQPTFHPSVFPTRRPSVPPTRSPTRTPTRLPTSQQPTSQPSRRPTGQPTIRPASFPSGQPSRQPTALPTSQPSRRPSSQPTGKPSSQPLSNPTSQPTNQPSRVPTRQPSALPSSEPSRKPSSQPSSQPTVQPTNQPSRRPTGQPTIRPSSFPSGQPSRQPTSQPFSIPTRQPSRVPTSQPSSQPFSNPTSQPTYRPSRVPTRQPSALPTGQPFGKPSNQPIEQPTAQPVAFPTSLPSENPSVQPSTVPTSFPSNQPTIRPSQQPTDKPSEIPSSVPSCQPSSLPSNSPTIRPSGQPTSLPSRFPSENPSVQPSSCPSRQPSEAPSTGPSSYPSGQPSSLPTTLPTSLPSNEPTTLPSSFPSSTPTNCPTRLPTVLPTCQPSSVPSVFPSVLPSVHPISNPSGQPTILPSSRPSSGPSRSPGDQPSSVPSGKSSVRPSIRPTESPTVQPTFLPSNVLIQFPTSRPSFPTSIRPPSAHPTAHPSTGFSSASPSAVVSSIPSVFPTESGPSSQPISIPTASPTYMVSPGPTTEPSSAATVPTQLPVMVPTRVPTNTLPTEIPSVNPPTSPESINYLQPSSYPSSVPSRRIPSSISNSPTIKPSGNPSLSPSINLPLLGLPSVQPTLLSSSVPSLTPSSGIGSTPVEEPTAVPTTLVSISVPSIEIPSFSSSPTVLPSVISTNVPSSDVSSSVCPSRLPTTAAGSTVAPSQMTLKPTVRPSLVPSAGPSNSVRPSIRLSPVGNIPVGPDLVFAVSNNVLKSSQLFVFGQFRSGSLSAVVPLNARSSGSTFIILGRKQPIRNLVLEEHVKSDYYNFVLKSSGLLLDSVSRSVTKVGDINGDSFEDYLVGDPLSSTCFGYFGLDESKLVSSLPASFQFISRASSDMLGWAATKVGDWNGDKYDDMAISALTINTVFIIYGRNSFPRELNLSQAITTTANGFRIVGSHSTHSFGMSLASAGDFNHDGFPDLCIGALKSVPGGGTQSLIYILFGPFPNNNHDVNMDLLSKQSYLQITSPLNSFAGLSLAGLGDINGDGIDDIAIGSVPYKGGYVTQQTFVLYGFKINNKNITELELGSFNSSQGFVVTGGGFMVSGLGDVNEDGLNDFLISSYYDWQGKGNAYLMTFPGNMTAFPTIQPSSRPSVSPSSSFPSSVPSSRSPSIHRANAPSFSPATVMTVKPSAIKVTPRPTKTPSLKPTSQSPTVSPSLKKTISPTSVKPTFIESIHPSTNKPTTTKPSRSPSCFPTSFPSFSPTHISVNESNFYRTIAILSNGSYLAEEGTKEFIVSGVGNYVFAGNNAKTIYTILPIPALAINNKQKMIVTIKDFRNAQDVLNLVYFPDFHSLNDIPYTTSPLTLVLSAYQLIILESHETMDLQEKNVLFASENQEENKGVFDTVLDSSFLVSLGVLVIGVSLMIVFVCIPANVDKDELEKKKIKEVERGEEEDAGRKEEKDIELGESVESSIKIAPTPEELSLYEMDKVQPVAAAPNDLTMIKNRTADSNYSSNASENDHSAQESGNSAPNDEDSLEGNEGCISEKSSSSSSGSSNNDNSSNSSGYSSKDSSINSFDSFSSVSFEDYEV
jgi:hypothetical protein